MYLCIFYFAAGPATAVEMDDNTSNITSPSQVNTQMFVYACKKSLINIYEYFVCIQLYYLIYLLLALYDKRGAFVNFYM